MFPAPMRVMLAIMVLTSIMLGISLYLESTRKITLVTESCLMVEEVYNKEGGLVETHEKVGVGSLRKGRTTCTWARVRTSESFQPRQLKASIKG